MRYNLSAIMRKAWSIFRKAPVTFSEALHRAWQSAKAEPLNTATIARAAHGAGITEKVDTWSGWRKSGYEVTHGAKALFSVTLIHASKGDGSTYRASFFGQSQVHPIM